LIKDTSNEEKLAEPLSKERRSFAVAAAYDNACM